MKKEHIRTAGVKRGHKRAPLLLIIFMCAVLLPAPAQAQFCESAGTANNNVRRIHAAMRTDLTNYFIQAENFIREKFKAMRWQVLARLDEWDKNIVTGNPAAPGVIMDSGLNAWYWRYRQPLMDMVRQLSVAYVDQTRQIGSLIDGQLLTEHILMRQKKEVEARRRYMPSELSCHIDSAGAAQTKAYQMSRALNRGFSNEAQKTRGNPPGSPAADGIGAEKSALWREYITYFCDNTKGDQGCTAPGTLAGRHKDIPALLWGNTQTIDPTVPENSFVVSAAQRWLVRPFSAEPVVASVVETADGHREILTRRAEEARINTVYNVTGQLIAERFGGSGMNTQVMRQAAGAPITEASTNASYREVQDTLIRDRFNDPNYIVHMTESPPQITREQITVNIIRLQAMFDMYRRTEEMLFMAAADYARDLDKQMPSPATQSMKMK